MYDNICKFLAIAFSEDIASWLLGEPIKLSELKPTELSLEPIRADSIVLRQSDQLILHAEFQTNTDADIPFRMADYRLRAYRRYPEKKMYQVVVYLKETRSQLAWENRFNLERTSHQFDVVRLWEKPTKMFFEAPGLYPFAVLSRTKNPQTVLTKISQEIDKIENRKMRNNLSAATSILSGLVLEEDEIYQILRRDIMRESVVYQGILREGLNEGLQIGKQKGIDEAKADCARNLLVLNMPPSQVAKATGLSISKVRKLQKDIKS